MAQRIIHIEDLEAGKDGIGTLQDPVNGNIPSRIDNLFLSHWDKPGMMFVFGPGTFPICGVANKNFQQLRRDWVLTGAGSRYTTLKLSALHLDTNPLSGWNTMLTTHFNDSGDIMIGGMTLDGNAQEMAKVRPNFGIQGIRAYGDSVTVRDVRCINMCGRRLLGDGSFGEEFAIGIGKLSGHSGYHEIDRCEVTRAYNPDGKGYISALCLMGTENASVRGSITNCQVHMNAGVAEFGLNLQWTRGCRYENNRIHDCARCLGNDTGTNDNLTVRGNELEPSIAGAFLISSINGTFEQNTITPWHGGTAGLVMYRTPFSACKGWIVRNNRFENPTKLATNYGLHTNWNGNTAPDGLIAYSNFFDPSLKHVVDPKSGLFRDNFDLNGKPIDFNKQFSIA